MDDREHQASPGLEHCAGCGQKTVEIKDVHQCHVRRHRVETGPWEIVDEVFKTTAQVAHVRCRVVLAGEGDLSEAQVNPYHPCGGLCDLGGNGPETTPGVEHRAAP